MSATKGVCRLVVYASRCRGNWVFSVHCGTRLGLLRLFFDGYRESKASLHSGPAPVSSCRYALVPVLFSHIANGANEANYGGDDDSGDQREHKQAETENTHRGLSYTASRLPAAGEGKSWLALVKGEGKSWLAVVTGEEKS